MEIIITQWALDSYLQLKHANMFSDEDYWGTIRPAVMLLRDYPDAPEFGNGKFFGPATGASGAIAGGYKMKWHNLGPGRIQLRLGVALWDEEAFLCEGYVKSSPQVDRRMMARFSFHIDQIREGNVIERGRLT